MMSIMLRLDLANHDQACMIIAFSWSSVILPQLRLTFKSILGHHLKTADEIYTDEIGTKPARLAGKQAERK